MEQEEDKWQSFPLFIQPYTEPLQQTKSEPMSWRKSAVESALSKPAVTQGVHVQTEEL